MLIYFLAYIPQMRYDLDEKSPVQYVVDYQNTMYSYHANLKAEHTYSSKSIGWLFGDKPLFVYQSLASEEGMSGKIHFYGTPII